MPKEPHEGPAQYHLGKKLGALSFWFFVTLEGSKDNSFCVEEEGGEGSTPSHYDALPEIGLEGIPIG